MPKTRIMNGEFSISVLFPQYNTRTWLLHVTETFLKKYLRLLWCEFPAKNCFWSVLEQKCQIVMVSCRATNCYLTLMAYKRLSTREKSYLF